MKIRLTLQVEYEEDLGFPGRYDNRVGEHYMRKEIEELITKSPQERAEYIAGFIECMDFQTKRWNVVKASVKEIT